MKKRPKRSKLNTKISPIQKPNFKIHKYEDVPPIPRDMDSGSIWPLVICVIAIALIVGINLIEVYDAPNPINPWRPIKIEVKNDQSR